MEETQTNYNKTFGVHGNFLRKFTSFFSARQSCKLVGILFILAVLPLGIYLVLKPAIFTPKAETSPVTVFLVPSLQNLPPDSSFQIMFDSNTHNISFVRIILTYSPSKILLTSEITTSSLNTVIRKTDMATANTSGRAEIVLGTSPGQSAATGVFQLASFSMRSNSSIENDPTSLLIDNLDIQIVDNNAQELTGNISPANITLNPVSPTPTPSPTPSPSPTASPTPEPTATTAPGITATSTPTITASPTPSPTPLATSTPSPTPTVTPYPTLSFGSSLTLTPTPTNQPISQETATPTTIASQAGTSQPSSSSGGSSSSSSSAPSTGSAASSKRGDANGDGKVNILDLSIVLSSFNKNVSGSADLNKDGKVNILDLSILLTNWGK